MKLNGHGQKQVSFQKTQIKLKPEAAELLKADTKSNLSRVRTQALDTLHVLKNAPERVATHTSHHTGEEEAIIKGGGKIVAVPASLLNITA